MSRIGVFGGMGPQATVDFMDKLVRLTPASRDQEHLPVIVASLPHIHDRSRAILETHKNAIGAQEVLFPALLPAEPYKVLILGDSLAATGFGAGVGGALRVGVRGRADARVAAPQEEERKKKGGCREV